MATLLVQPYLQFFDENGDPLSGGKIYTYAAGTTTPKATYTDYTGDTPASNPVILDSAGRTTMWGQGSYKFVVKNADDVEIETTDHITVFNTTPPGNDTFFETFSGDGQQTVFTMSEDLGTDEKALLVFVDNGLNEYVTNGNFATDTGWDKGTGWTIGSGVATATGAISTPLEQDAAVELVEGQSYNVTFTMTRSAGSLTVSIGGQSGTSRSASGTYTETIIAGSSQKITFGTSGFTGTLDNVTVQKVAPAGPDIVPPTQYTIDGTSLTFAVAPAVGNNNIFVFAPSLLVGAAAASATQAEEFANAAESFANAAEVSKDAAVVAQEAAETAWDDFDDLYLGQKASDPTLDNDGDPLQTGALYFNTVSNEMRVYTGSIWTAAYVPDGGFLVAGNNLNDLTNVSDARDNLGVTALFDSVDDELDLKLDSLLDISAETSNITISAANFKEIKSFNDSGAEVVTVPSDATEDLPVGFWMIAVRTGTGGVSITAEDGVTLNKPTGMTTDLRVQGSSCIIYKEAANVWRIIGDLEEA